MVKSYIIAEAGVNHNGSEALALQMIQDAKKMGADAVKFQLFQAEALTTMRACQAEYQKKNTSLEQSQYNLLKQLELSFKSFQKLRDCAKSEGIDFIVTPFDLESLEYIIHDLDLPIIKIGSGDVTNGPLLLNAARSLKKIILSTGMCDLAEIELALKVLAFGYLEKSQLPSQQTLADAYNDSRAYDILREKIILLHCTSEYPAPVNEVNLKAIDTLSAAFGLPVGFSDHTIGFHITTAAIARGACVIEKHFTLDKTLPGPDHLASIDPAEFSLMMQQIREIEFALGQGRKHPTPSEKKNRELVRRSIVASKSISQGECFSASNLAIKRPCSGQTPMLYWDYLGKSAKKTYSKDEAIDDIR